jgi:hypothetical protein
MRMQESFSIKRSWHSMRILIGDSLDVWTHAVLSLRISRTLVPAPWEHARIFHNEQNSDEWSDCFHTNRGRLERSIYDISTWKMFFQHKESAKSQKRNSLEPGIDDFVCT